MWYTISMNLKEYRCPRCNKLLCKGHFTCKEDILEVKCRGCGQLSQFLGEDAQTIEIRHELITNGLMADPESN